MASIYDKQILSKADYERIKNLNDAWLNTTDKKLKDGLHAQAEAIRNSYGYSGGADGNQFIINHAGVINTAAATKGYTDALEGARLSLSENFLNESARIKRDTNDRLREAYIKNMHDSLGLSQALKSAGVSGGASESTVAYMNNVYNNSRNDIKNDAGDKLLDLGIKNNEALADIDKDIAKALYDGAIKRTDALAEAEKTAYDRAQNEREFEYTKAKDERDFEYNKSKDERDFEYKKAQDEISNSIARSKATSGGGASSDNGTKLTPANAIALIKSGIYNPHFAEILGITDDEVRDMIDDFNSESAKSAAWKMMQNGIYDDSFPEIVGYSAEILEAYVTSVLNGF